MITLTVSLKKHGMFPDTTDTIMSIVLCSKERLLHLGRNNIDSDLEQNILAGSK